MTNGIGESVYTPPKSKEELVVPFGMAVTGRVQNWLEGGKGRLPVSCTTLTPSDSMEGEGGLEWSWLFVSNALRYGAGVALDMSGIRAKNSVNEYGLVASGPVSFMRIYSTLNEILRRGGIYKQGAIVCFLDYDHPDLPEFLAAPASMLNWVKRAVYVDEGVKDSPHLEIIAKAADQGIIFLAKKRWDSEGNRLYSNVCQEIAIPSRATCLLSHVHAAVLEPSQIAQAYEDGAKFLTDLHAVTGVDESGYYLSPQEDRQVGLGTIGLASFLAIQGITYREFTDALLEYEVKTSGFREDLIEAQERHSKELEGVHYIAHQFALGFLKAARVAKARGFKRLFTVAPTASCFTRYEDSEGFATTPEISAPLGREVDRNSETHGITTFEFNPKCETAQEVGWTTQWEFLNTWQRLMNIYDMGHAISANIWSECTVSPEWITDVFLPSDLFTSYYRWQTHQQTNDKSQIISDESLDKLAYLEKPQKTEEPGGFFIKKAEGFQADTDPGVACPVDDGSGSCSACDGS